MDPDSPPPPLHALDPTRRFSDRAADYRRFRPDYPEAAIAAVLAGLGEPSRLLAADVGAGTGIAARALAGRGVRVIAIEPNAGMRSEAEPHPAIEWREGTAEASGLGGASVHLVLCAQSFHWFRPQAALAEFHRVLRPHGRLVILWNRRDRGDPATLEFIEAIHAVNGEHPAERWTFDPGVVAGAPGAAGSGFDPPRLETFDHAQELDLAGLLGRARSASYVPKQGALGERLTRLLGELFERHRDAAGRVRLCYRTQVYLTERR